MVTRKRKGGASKRVQMTPNQLAYAKAQKNLQKRIKNAEKGGYVFFENVVPTTPKRITKKHIDELNEIKGRKLYTHAQYVAPETGELIGGIEGMHLKRKKAASKARMAKQAKRKSDSFFEDDYYPDGGEIAYDNVMDEYISKTYSDTAPDYEEQVNKLLSELEQDTPDYLVNMRGKRYKKRLDAIEESTRCKNVLLRVTVNAIANTSKSALGWALHQNADEVNSLVQYIMYGSDSTKIQTATNRLAEIINGGALTMDELMTIGDTDSYNEDYESIDDED